MRKDATASYSENCQTLRIEDEIITESLRIYPNPVTDIFNIESILKNVEIHNLLGQEAKVIDGEFNSINLRDLSIAAKQLQI